MAEIEPLEITVCKADSSAGEPTRPAILRITGDLQGTALGCVPESVWRPAALRRFHEEAERIMRALASLPQGTTDQLLLLLLEQRASVLRVRGEAGGHTEPETCGPWLNLLRAAQGVVEGWRSGKGVNKAPLVKAVEALGEVSHG